MSRRQYPKHRNDAIDRFITERSSIDGKFSFDRMVELFAALDCPPDFIPPQGSNGTRRMTAGIALRNWFPDGLVRFRDGTTVQLEESD